MTKTEAANITMRAMVRAVDGPRLPNAQERLRVNMGLQCPECHGVNIETPERQRHLCRDCGCQWDRYYYPSLKVS